MTNSTDRGGAAQPTSLSLRVLLTTVMLAAVVTVAITALLINIEHKQGAKNPFYRVVELNDTIDDPKTWAKDFPLQYDLYKHTVGMRRTKYGEAKPCRNRRPKPTRAGFAPSCRKVYG